MGNCVLSDGINDSQRRYGLIVKSVGVKKEGAPNVAPSFYSVVTKPSR